MPDRGFNVIIIGAGVGGLALAQGLHRSGVRFAVYERDADVFSRQQGFRIHLSEEGALGLFPCLPPKLLQAVVDTAGRPGHQITIAGSSLKKIRTIQLADPNAPVLPPPFGFNAPVDRSTLRQILLGGLGEFVHFNKEFVGYERLENQRIRAHFADGSSADASLLIGADGTGSRVRQQLLPEAEPRDSGQRTIFGKTLLTDATRPLLPPFLSEGFGAVIGRQRRGMALGLMEFQTRPETITVTVRPRTKLSPAPDYLMWALTVPSAQLPAPDETMHELQGAELLRITLSLMDDWHDDLRALVAAGDEAHVAFTPIRLATEVPPWETTNVTLLGDAIHTMSPSGGSGANIALRDAGLLCQQIEFADSGVFPLLDALHDYEVDMLNYGFAAVRESERGLQWRRNPLALPFILFDKVKGRIRRP